MEAMRLREVCDALGVSRRAIQGYEKAGLISPSGKNERGYLLYNKKAQDRIKEIKLFQQIGFTLKEIGNIIDAPGDIQKMALEERLARMKEEKRNMETLIYEVKKKTELLCFVRI